MRFGKGSRHTQESRDKISKGLLGNKRRWKGKNAGYVAIHMWIKKHWGIPDHCDMCHCLTASRYEWCNLDKKYRRVRGDWIQLCPSCHRKYDHALIREEVYRGTCINGHLLCENTTYNSRGHFICRTCRNEAQRRWKNAKTN